MNDPTQKREGGGARGGGGEGSGGGDLGPFGAEELVEVAALHVFEDDEEVPRGLEARDVLRHARVVWGGAGERMGAGGGWTPLDPIGSGIGGGCPLWRLGCGEALRGSMLEQLKYRKNVKHDCPK